MCCFTCLKNIFSPQCLKITTIVCTLISMLGITIYFLLSVFMWRGFIAFNLFILFTWLGLGMLLIIGVLRRSTIMISIYLCIECVLFGLTVIAALFCIVFAAIDPDRFINTFRDTTLAREDALGLVLALILVYFFHLSKFLREIVK